MLWMKHNVKHCNNLLGGKLWTTPDQRHEQYHGSIMTVFRKGKVWWCLLNLWSGVFCLLRREVEKTPDAFYFSSWGTTPPPHPYLKWINIWLAYHNQDSNCTRPKKRLLPNIFVLRENNGYVQLSLLWKTCTNLFLWWSNIRWSFTSCSMLLLALKFKKNLSQGEYFNYGNYKHCNLVGHQT